MAKRRKSTKDDSLFDGAAGAADEVRNGSGDSAVALHEAAQTRYLNYALSVITSRALPDVRDGLKPVQRRILYTMGLLGLRADAKHRKCANVVGEVMGKYHPHGDSAIYDALVRMAQPFVMRHTLVDGSGNFGSLDGDPPAAMRYTECRLSPIAGEMLGDLGRGTVHHRPTYDNAREEPVVLPSKVPNLLLNGSSGIAVGMATNIPPHNLEEICAALVRLIDDPELSSAQLARTVKGPDFPTGGQILNTRDELRDIYKSGQGAVKMRATWEKGPTSRAAQTLFITSVPYGVNKAVLVEQIAQVVMSRKMPLLLDVKDVSTEDVRIELQLKKDADVQKVMAYLFRHTLLQTNFNVNLTCLVPTENPEVGRPQRCELREVLSYFLQFRLEVVTRRLQHELDQLNRRMHILEGFELIFDALDEIIKIIRASDGKADAAAKIIKRFKLDEEQTDAILELKLYRLAKLEILVIQQELAEKRKRAKEITKLLREEEATGRWKIVRGEIGEISKTYGSAAAGGKRRTIIESAEDEPEFSAEDFIIAEDSHVLVTADGWVKRQKEINPATTRLREGDRILTVEAGSTRATIAFFSNFGTAYSCRIIDLPATTGYGEPIQKLFKLKDGERIIAAFSMDPRTVGEIHEDPKQPDYAPLTHGFAATSDGYALRFGLQSFAEPSTRSGRRYARPSKGSQVVYMSTVHGRETIIAATGQRRAILCRADEVNYLSGPGKGVQLIRLSKDDRLLAALAANDDRDTLIVRTSMGGEQRINTGKYKVTGRGGKGHEIIKRGQLVEALPEEVAAPALLEEEG